MNTYRTLFFLFGFVSCSVVALCPKGWVEYSQKCYFFSENNYNFDTAKSLCESRKAKLASLNSVPERDFISNIVASRGYQMWIGARRQNQTAPFMWVDGSSPPPDDPSIRNWDEQATSNGNCVWVNFWNKQWQKVTCWAIKAYICERSYDVVDLCDFEDDWHHLENSCFKYFQVRETWEDAKDNCEVEDGDLVVLNDTVRMRVFQEVVNCKDYRSNVWVGLSDMDSPGQLKWVNGRNLGSPTNWADGQPDTDVAAGERCVSAVTANEYKWVVAECEDEEQYVCEKPEGTCAPGWRDHGAFCYAVVATDKKKTFSDALQYCEAMGANLMDVTSQTKQDALKQIVSNIKSSGVDRVRIGLSDMHDDNEFEWTTGEPLEYASWAPDGYRMVDERWDCASVDTDNTAAEWELDYCFDKQAFICQLPKHTSPEDPDTSNDYLCESGWTVSRNKCYKVMDQDVTWDQADQDCHSQGALQIQIKDEDVQSFASGNLRGDTWSGLRLSNGDWKWADGTEPGFLNWEPDNPVDGEPCMMLDGEASMAGMWHSAPCGERHKYICMKDARHIDTPTTKAPPTPSWSSKCGVGWYYNAMSGYCYQVNRDRKAWPEGMQVCRQRGGDLVSISSLDEQGYITALLATQTVNSVYWIGANDRDTSSGWQWSDGSAFAFFYWQPGEPNNARKNEYCVEIGMNKEGRWNDHSCDWKYGYICKKKGKGVTIPTPTPEPEPTCSGNDPMISGTHYLMDTYLSASSSESNRGAPKSRLNGNSCWSAGQDNNAQFIQADFSYPILVKKVGTQGAPDRDEWVTRYKLMYRFDDQAHDNFYSDDNGADKVFDGNGDKGTVVTHDLARPFMARYVRFVPTSFEGGISMRIEVYGCKAEDCSAEYLISGDVVVYKTRLSASSDTPDHQAANARLKEVGDGLRQPGWTPQVSNANQWIQAKLDVPLRIRQIATKGRADANNFVKKYKFQYSNTGNNWVTYQEPMGTDKVFTGNSDNTGLVIRTLLSPVDAKFVRIVPIDWQGAIGLRFDILGCARACGAEPLITGPKHRVHDSQLTASSSYDVNHSPARSRLNQPKQGNLRGAWSPRPLDNKQFIQVDFRIGIRILAVATQGRNGYSTPQYVLTYKLLYNNGRGWITYKENKQDKIFAGNWDTDTVSKHYLLSPFNAQMVRVNPQSFQNHISLRWEIYGCPGPLARKDVGCYVDHREDRDLPYAPWEKAAGGMTRYACSRHCFHSSYMYSGVQEGQKCFCGNQYGRYGISYNCKIPCQGNPRYNCGGPESNWISTTGLGATHERCKDGWVLGPDDRCYLFQKQWFKGAEAKAFCMNQGGTLATVNSRTMQAFMEENLGNMQRDSWIGLHSYNQHNYFEWWSGEPVLYTNWNRREPNSYKNTDEDCVMIYWRNGKWNDESCNNVRAAICMMDKQVLPSPPPTTPNPGCGPDWVAYRWKCYHVNSAPRQWSWHKTTCESKGGNLVRIEDRFEQAFLTSHLGSRAGSFYTDLSDRTTRGYFIYSNGQPPTYTHWDVGQPKAANYASCVAIQSGNKYGTWNSFNCASPRGGVCEKPSSTVTRPTGPTTPAAGNCPAGWSAFGFYCYQFNNMGSPLLRKNWVQAQQDCQQKGGELVSMHSPQENDWIHADNARHQSVYYWLGLNQRQGQSGFRWSDGTAVDYVNWAPGQPSANNGSVACTHMLYSSGQWESATCSYLQNWICKARQGSNITVITTPTYPSAEPPGSCAPDGDSWKKYNGRCWYLSTPADGRLSWQQSRAKCRSNGSELASFHSQQELSFMMGQIQASTGSLPSDIWIGLSKLLDGSWKWSDGTGTDYTNWGEGAPSNDGFLGCAAMNTPESGDFGKWHDTHCSFPKNFICVKGNTTPPPPVIKVGNCPQGWLQSTTKCYKLVTGEDVTWNAALQKCQGMGDTATLASIHNRVEQAFLTKELVGVQKSMWIGMKRILQSWVWIDQSDTSYTNWARGEPNGAGADKCAEFYSVSNRAGRWNDASCTSVKGYVCQMELDASIPSPPSRPNSCPAGMYQWNNDCYQVTNTLTDWQTAEDACKGQGHLTSVLSPYEQALVVSLTVVQVQPELAQIELLADDQHAWIGLSDKANPGRYHWADGWTMMYSNWGQGQPSNPDGGCVITNQTDGKWYDVPCSGQYRSVCKKSDKQPTVTRPPPGQAICPDNDIKDQWILYNNFCYLFKPDEQVTVSNARFQCSIKNSDLVSIHSDAENTFVMDHIHQGQGRVWLGLMRMTQIGFNWLDGSVVDYTKWNKGEPNNAGNGENCAEIYEVEGVWNDIKCGNLNGYICKRIPARYISRPSDRTATATQPWTGIPTQRVVQPGLAGGAKAGIAIGVLVVIAVVATGAVLLTRYRGLQMLKKKLSRDHDDDGFTNPSYGPGSDTVTLDQASSSTT